MQKIVPHLWYDKEVAEAAAFYVSVFPESSMENVASLEDTPSGNVKTASIKLAGLEFILLAARAMLEMKKLEFEGLRKASEG